MEHYIIIHIYYGFIFHTIKNAKKELVQIYLRNFARPVSDMDQNMVNIVKK